LSQATTGPGGGGGKGSAIRREDQHRDKKTRGEKRIWRNSEKPLIARLEKTKENDRDGPGRGRTKRRPNFNGLGPTQTMKGYVKKPKGGIPKMGDDNRDGENSQQRKKGVAWGTRPLRKGHGTGITIATSEWKIVS